MSTGEIIGLSITLLVMMVGFVGSVLPMLPGPILVLVAALGHWIWFREHSASPFVLLLLAALTAASLVLDYVASMYGAKRFGATWRGVVGAFVGGIIGIFFNLPGIILGPFVGAMLFELLGGYEFDKASRAGLGATIGVFGAIIGRCAICAVMMAAFTVSVILRS